MIQVWSNFLLEREIQNLQHAISNKYIMEGPILKEFQERLKDILNVRHVIGTASGTAALALALMGIGIQPGDEVIVPDLTFIATANAACLLGAKVLVAQTQPDRPLLDLAKIDALVTQKTKAIITVDLNGRISGSRELKDKYSAKGIYIIDDACQALMSGPQSGMAGTQADIGCYSFGITKTVSTVNGGLVVTDHDDLYERMRVMKTQGMESVFESDTYIYPGFNFKLPDVLAAIGNAQLDCLDEKLRHMREIDDMYREGLAGVEGISFLDKKEDEFIWMTDILCSNRDRVREVLMEKEILSRPLGAPLHTAGFLVKRGNYENSTDLQNKILYLPGGPNQDLKNIEKVIKTLKNSDLIGENKDGRVSFGIL